MVSKATLGRVPLYLEYVSSLPQKEGSYISATAVSKALGLGEVQVRKDLSAISGQGKPRVGYQVSELLKKLTQTLVGDAPMKAVVVGAGRLGRAILEYDGFLNFGMDLVAAFDRDPAKHGELHGGRRVLPLSELPEYCKREGVSVGIITVPSEVAQKYCDEMVENGVMAIWNFSSAQLSVPEGVVVKKEDLALSLAYLRLQIGK